jgi:AraC-like DNA-binding protein
MLELIHARFADAMSLPVLGAAIGRQSSYLGRLFHSEVGVTVREYVRGLRLKHATELIRDGVKIEAVALVVGYRSKKNFYRQFRQSFGTTPGGFRHQDAQPASGRALTPHGSATAAPQSTAADAVARRPFRDERSTPAPDSPGAPGPSSRALCEVNLSACHHALALAVRFQRTLLREFRDSRLAMLLTDERGRYVGANRSAVSIIGYTPPEFRELTARDIFSGSPEQGTRCVWQIVLTAPRQPVNAVLHAKTRQALSVHLVTLKNLLWGGPEMSAMLEGMPR